MNKRLSIIITTLDKPELVEQCIESIHENTSPGYEIILVDDGSTLENSRIFQQMEVNHLVDTLVIHKKNKGTAGAMNSGIKASNGEYLAIINNDILLTQGWEKPLIDVLSDDIWISGPVITEGEIPEGFPVVEDNKKMVNFLPVQGCCLVCKKELFDKIGYFPEELRLWYNDNWLGDSCKKHNKKVVTLRTSYVHHLRSQTANIEVIPDLAEIAEQNRIAYETKYNPLRNGKKVFVAHPYYRTNLTKNFYLGMVETIGSYPYGLQIEMGGNYSIVRARNELVKTFLKSTCNYLFFVDVDMGIPANGLKQLVEDDKDIIGALCFQRVPPHNPTLMMEDSITEEAYNYTFIREYPEDIIEVDATGTGVLLIKREVLESMEEPWFDEPNNACSEDIFFCKYARKKGYKVFVDTRVKTTHFAEFIIGEKDKKVYD